MTRSRPALATVAVATLVAVGAVGCGAVGRASSDPVVRVASGPDAESALLAAVAVELLEAEGIAAAAVPFVAARDSRVALELGDVDLRIGYSGEAWLDVLGLPDPPGDPGRSVDAVRAADLERGIVWLVPPAGPDGGAGTDEAPANATFAFVVAGPPSIDADLRTVSQLAARLAERPEATVCVDPDFGRRPDGLPAVLRAYSVRSDRPFVAADPAAAVRAVAAGECLAGLTTASDGAAWLAGLHPLVDDLRVFPAFVPLPQVRAAVLGGVPGIPRALRPLVEGLTTEELRRANARVLAGASVEEAASSLVARLRLRLLPTD